MGKRKDDKNRVLRDGEYQKKDGRYEYRFVDSRGRPRSVYSWRLVETDRCPAGKKDSPALRELEKDITHDLNDGISYTKDLTLNDMWDMYFSQKLEIKPSTRVSYQHNYDKHVRGDIGNMQLTNIKFTTIKSFYGRLIREKKLKVSTVNNLNIILHPVFTYAIRDGIIRFNPTEGVMKEITKITEWKRPKRHALTIQEQDVFMEYIASHERFKRYHSFFTFLLGTGCRIGEAVGLRWEDINWKENTISINHSLAFSQQENGRYAARIDTPKTENGYRDIPMFSAIREILERERVWQISYGGCQDVIDGYSGFVWHNRDNHVIDPRAFNSQFRRIIDSYNEQETEKAKNESREPFLLPYFTAHNLRHTFCTRLCENESDLKLIQEIMGHANISTTMDIYNESNIQRKIDSFERIEQQMRLV